jgi:hypothetical protein
MITAWIAIIAKIGDKSRPLIGRKKFLYGFNKGSAIFSTIFFNGVYDDGAIQLKTIWIIMAKKNRLALVKQSSRNVPINIVVMLISWSEIRDKIKISKY